MSALRWAENLSGRGHEVTTIVPQGSRLEEEAGARALSRITVPLISRNFDFRASARIRSFLKQTGTEIVQAHSSKDLWILYLSLVGLAGPRLFFANRILFKDTSKRDPLHNLIHRRVEAVIVQTEFGKKAFAACTNVPLERIVVIPNGFEPKAFETAPGVRESARAEFGLSQNDVAIGCTSRIDRQKGQYELLEAFRQVRGRHENVRLVLAGEPTLFEGDQYMEFLKRKIAEYDLGRAVILTGFRKDIPRVLGALDIFVMPSYEETFGSCLVEAMLAGLPCVSTDAGGVPEILEGGKIGLLVEPKSVEGLVRAIATLIENVGIRRDLAAKARESARRRYDRSTVIKMIEDLYSGRSHK